jgi:hypothetical protein
MQTCSVVYTSCFPQLACVPPCPQASLSVVSRQQQSKILDLMGQFHDVLQVSH